jgi:hypothetical protein
MRSSARSGDGEQIQPDAAERLVVHAVVNDLGD